MFDCVSEMNVGNAKFKCGGQSADRACKFKKNHREYPDKFLKDKNYIKQASKKFREITSSSRKATS